MAENGVSEMGDNHDGTELTMIDVLEEEQELEEDAKAVLGDSDDKNCTYNQGYVKRQALYACATCGSEDEPGGICLACSYACHEGHELFELYTKRYFRCDCGNKKFATNRCHLYPNKENINVNNKYNQNFKGKYCNCERPYPDLVDDIPDDMIQCIICEDWYHGRHLGGNVPDNSDFGEMICAVCMESHTFLYHYLSYFNANELSKINDSGECNSLKNSEFKKSGESKSPCKTEENEQSQYKNDEAKPKTVSKPNQQEKEKSIKLETENECVQNFVKTTCALKNLASVKVENTDGPAFLPEGWRKKLCQCPECIVLYETKCCLFLLDEEDTIHAYEERGKCRSGDESQYDKGLSALGTLDRVKQLEAIHEYNNMKTELKDFLKQFADSKKTVREEDIREFFSQMEGRKRQKVESHVPYFCR